MKISVKLNPTSTIKTQLGIQDKGPAHAFLTNTCYKYMGQFVPSGDTGLLNQNVTLKKDQITYESPYAQYQYYGKLMVDPITGKGAFYSEDYGYWSRPSKYGIPKILTNRDLVSHTLGTGSQWDKRMWTSKGDQVVKEVQNYIDRGCK